MSRTKQADANLSKPTGYLHQLRIYWADQLPTLGDVPAWKVKFTYGIFPLTKMPFTGTGVVYLNGDRLWVRNLDFEKARGEFAIVLEDGLNHALKELGDEAVKAVEELAAQGGARTASSLREAAYLALANRLPIGCPERRELLRLAGVDPTYR